MKHKIILILSFVLIFSVPLFSQGVSITILHVNDSHSNIDATGPKDQNLNGTIGGIARFSTLINQTRQTEQNVLVFHAGDFCVGDFFYNRYFGVPELQILKMLNIDALTAGNHEFDLTPYILLGTFQNGFVNGSFPVLSANLDLSGFTPLSAYIQPSIMKTISGVKTGIFGLTIPNELNNPSPVIVLPNLSEIAQQTANNLKSAGADVVILLSHAGLSNDKLIAAADSNINFIIGGHDHSALQQPVQILNPLNQTVYIVQAGNYYHYAGKFKFNFNNGVAGFTSYQLINLDQSIQPDPVIQNVVEQLKPGIVSYFGEVFTTVLGVTNNYLTKNIEPQSVNKDSPLGNLVTDAYKWKAGAFLSITAIGLISQNIYAGPITPADVFRTLPYGYDTTNGLGFRLVRFDIKGSELIRGLELGLQLADISEDYALQVSGLNFRYSSKRPVNSRLIPGTVRIDSFHVLSNFEYACAVDEGVYTLLNLYGIKTERMSYWGNCYTALYDFVNLKDTVDYISEGRIKDAAMINTTGTLQGENNFGIEGNFPNPFNPSTTISFRMPESGFGRLEIFDITGRLVGILFEGNLMPGSHELIWNASNLPSGVYFAKFSALGFNDVKKIMLLK